MKFLVDTHGKLCSIYAENFRKFPKTLYMSIVIWTYIAEDLHLWLICAYMWPYIDILVYGVDFMVPIDPKCDSTMSRYPVFCTTPSELGERSILIFFAGSSAQIWKIVDLKNFRSRKCRKSTMPKSHQNRFWRLLRFSIFNIFFRFFFRCFFWNWTRENIFFGVEIFVWV